MTTIAFIGLGTMGMPMAGHLRDAGFDVRGYSRTPKTRARFAEAGGVDAADIRSAVEQAQIVCLMLPDGPDVDEVMTAADGVLAHLGRGSLVVDFSTIAPATARRMAEAAAERGSDYVDAPVSGGESGAIEGTLAVMAGGSAEAVERARAVIEPVSGTVRRVGEAGSGQVVKAANQMMVAGHLAITAEALQLLKVHDVDMSAALEVLGGGLAGSTVLTRKAEAMLTGDTRPGFRLELHHKDLGIAAELARTAGVATPVSAVVSQLVAAMVATGRGQYDHSAVVQVIDSLSSTGGDR